MDLSLCISNFRTALMFPLELGGSALSDAAMQRLSQCPVANPPCQNQKNASVFATWPMVMPSFQGQDVGAGCQNTDALTCAKLCLRSPSCNAFAYNQNLQGGTCCMKANPSTDMQLDLNGWQMHWLLPSGTTAEDPFFQSASWGKCSQSFMQSFCNKSCGRCGSPAPAPGVSLVPAASPAPASPAPSPSPAAAPTAGPPCTCSDVNPNQYLCEDEARWGKCRNDYITKTTPDLPEGFCQLSCGRCPCDYVTKNKCTDVPPTPWYTCKQQKAWGKCNDAFMFADPKHVEGSCQVTCGRCKAS
ncbi:hypothetical protein N2152v2_002448 [Parachlorella kessleri]